MPQCSEGSNACPWVSLLRPWVKAIPVKLVIIFLGVQLLIALLALVILGIIPVGKEVERVKAQLGSAYQEPIHAHPHAQLIDSIQSLLHHEEFLRAALEISEADSMSLLINLSDSVLTLSFKGVALLQTPIAEARLSQGLRRLPTRLRDSLFVGPHSASYQLASIEKHPIVVRQAPRDTIEASAAPAPTLPVGDDVFFLLATQGQLAIEVVQQEPLTGARQAYRRYTRQRDRWFRQQHRQAMRGDAGGYIYRLTISVPREDARSIFRALPTAPLLAIRFAPGPT